MKFTADRQKFQDAIASTVRVLESRNTIPVLGYLRLAVNAKSGTLEIRGTDLDMEARNRIGVEAEQGGTVLAPGRMLSDIVRKLASETVTLEETEPGRLVLRGGRSKFNMMSLPEADYPDITSDNPSFSATLPASALAESMRNVEFAISAEEIRYYLNGIFFHRSLDGDLRMVATNGHQLARTAVSIDSKEDPPSIIIPRKTVGEILTICRGAGDEPITIACSPNKIRVTFGDMELVSKLIDGTFPDYDRVVPKNNTKRLVVDALRFAEAVDRVAVISNERGRAVKLDIGDGKVEVTVVNPDSGEARDEIDAEWSDPAVLSIGFNHGYLSSMMKLLGGKVEVLFDDPGSPTLMGRLKDNGERDQNSPMLVLMPMRV